MVKVPRKKETAEKPVVTQVKETASALSPLSVPRVVKRQTTLRLSVQTHIRVQRIYDNCGEEKTATQIVEEAVFKYAQEFGVERVSEDEVLAWLEEHKIAVSSKKR